MIRRALQLALLLFLALPAFGQASNWCSSGTASGNDPLNPANYSFGSPTGTTTSLWVTDSLAKYQQTVANTVTSDKGAKPCGAKGEFVDFQVHYKNSTGVSKTLDYSVTDLVQTVSPNTHISAATGIKVYGEVYYKVNTVSEMENDSTAGNLTVCPNTGLTTANCFVPDALVPKVEPYHSQTTSEFPITVVNGNTQSLWYELQIPTSAPSGYYTGTITITENGSTLATLPITLAVWNFALPATSSLNTDYGSDTQDPCLGYFGVGVTGCGAGYPGSSSDDNALMLGDLDIAYMLLDHRMSFGNSPVWGGGDGNGNGPPHSPTAWTNFDSKYGPLLDGTSTHLLLSGAKMTQISMGDQANNNADAQYWSTHFSGKPWYQLFDYLQDEPGTNATLWGNAATNAAKTDSASPIVPGLVTTNFFCASNNYASSNPSPLQFINYQVFTFSDLNPSGPECSGGTVLQHSTYNAWLGGGSGSFSVQCGLAGNPPCPQVWGYEACTSHNTCDNNQWGGGDGRGTASRDTGVAGFPSLMIDGDSVRNRVHPWVAASFPTTGVLYYDLMFCWQVSPFPTCQTQYNTTSSDPWQAQYVFGGNGDGTLIYPGTFAKIGTGMAANWIPVPIASIRIKNQRDGMQDYEYIKQLRDQGQSSFVTTQIATFYTNSYTYTNCNVDGSGTGCGQHDVIGCNGCLMAARNAMGEKLHELAQGSTQVNGVHRGMLP